MTGRRAGFDNQAYPLAVRVAQMPPLVLRMREPR
jgi:hypothetical protein